MRAVPNRDRAVADPVKISDYLLSETHPVGRYKARFFKRAAFARTLLKNSHGGVSIDVSPIGSKYRVEGHLLTPDGRNPLVGTIWIILNRATIPRFVKAFPC